jgi:protein ImuA
MDAAKSQILSQLKKDILPLQGFKQLSTDNTINIGFRQIEKAFPNACFPIGCMHEFISNTASDMVATNGFIACLLGKLMQLGGACVWISTSGALFPAALKGFGIEPEKIIFIDLKKEKDVLYATEEALKCNKLTAVLADIKNISFKESRRFQLAAEQSRVTGFIIRHQPQSVNTIACISRWHITSLPSQLEDEMPGVGFPRWNVELLKVRNGSTGKWNIEWAANTFKEVKETITIMPQKEIRKVS